MRKEGYYTEKGEPIKCLNCNSTSFKDVIKDRCESTIMECERVCNDCGCVIGYWLTGNWMLM